MMLAPPAYYLGLLKHSSFSVQQRETVVVKQGYIPVAVCTQARTEGFARTKILTDF